jgi:hypothetical protein
MLKLLVADLYKSYGMHGQHVATELVVFSPLLTARNSGRDNPSVKERNRSEALALVVLHHELQVPIVSVHWQSKSLATSTLITAKEFEPVAAAGSPFEEFVAQVDDVSFALRSRHS